MKVHGEFPRLPKAISHSTVFKSGPTPNPGSELFHIYVMSLRGNRPLRIAPADIILYIERARIPRHAGAAAESAGIRR